VNVRFEPSRGLSGELRVPTDKSISHRAALLGAMSAEPVRIARFLDAADTLSTLEAVQALGALVERRDGEVVIRGTGLREAREPGHAIDVGNAGTLLRLLPGWLSAQQGRTFTLDGDESIRRRPVDRIAGPLRRMGADLEARDGRLPPLVVRGAHLHAIDHELAVASAQVKSCLLIAALAADGETTVAEPGLSRDHTERMLLRAGVSISRAGRTVSVVNADELALGSISVPGDLSSAAFLIAAGVLVPGFLRIVRRMRGIVLGDLEEHCEAISPQEPTSDLDVAHGALEGTVVEAAEVPLAIDELPLVALLGCFAEGETIVRGAGELRLKESDRIAAVVEGLRGLGADIEATDDGFAVTGSGGGLRGGTIDARGDHRIAMMGAVAGLASREGVEVLGMESAAISYPQFGAHLAELTG
jgi:3-phosphoshikimate 1-carboxyvinyltransferase